MKIPESIKPVWRTVQLVRITKGLDDGLRLFIVGPFLYDTFKQVSGTETAMLYASIAWAIYFGMIAFLEIPTGLLADVFGRVYAIIACFVCNMLFALGLASLMLFNNVSLIFVMVVLFSIVRAIAVTFYNGSFYAWMVDSIREKAPDFGYERLISRGYAYYSWSMVVGAVLGVTFYLHGVAYVAFILGAFFCLNGATYCATSMQETRAIHFSKLENFWENAGSRIATTLITAFRVCHQAPVLWWLLAVYGCYTFCSNVINYLWPIVLSVQYGAAKWSMQWYFMAFSVPAATAVYSHILTWAGNRSQSRGGSKLSQMSLAKWLYISCWIGCAAILLLGFLQVKSSVTFLFFASGVITFLATNGVVDSCNSALINEFIPHKNSKERATIMSVGSMLKGLLILIFLVPSSMPSHSATVLGWVLPAGILALILFFSQIFVKKWISSKSKSENQSAVPLLSEEGI